jgi:hypothetical protein
VIEVDTVESPGWWLLRCHRKLQLRLPRLERLELYRSGNPPFARRSEVEKEAFRAFQKTARLNMAETLISSITERLTVRAIRTSQGTTEAGDSLAWDVFKANMLHVELPDVLDNMLGLSDAYMMVGVNPDAGDKPTAEDIWITGEDPRQVVTIHDPVRQSQIRAGAKFYHDHDEDRDDAVLCRPGVVYTAFRPRKSRAKSSVSFSGSSWSWDEERGGEDGIDYPAGLEDAVGIVRFRNRKGVAEFEPHIDVLDRINHMILQRMVIVTMQAFRQRALKGDFPTVYPADWPDESLRGQKIDYDELFVSSPDALWLIPGAAEIWESAQADIQGVLTAVQDDLKHLAAASGRPFWIFAPDNQSASGAEHANDGLVFAVEDRAMRAGQAIAQVESLALRFMGETERAKLGAITVDWMPFERHSLQTKAAAAQAAKAAGHSDRFILENVWQLTPEEIAIEEQAKAADQLAVAALTGTRSPGGTGASAA